MNWLRGSIQLLLAGLGYTEGILATLAYKHRHNDQLIIFMTGGFILGLISSVSVFLKDSATLLSIQSVVYAYFLSSAVVLVFFFSDPFTQSNATIEPIFFPHHFFQVVLILIFLSMGMIGASVLQGFVSKYKCQRSDSSLPGDPESDATGWQSDSSHADELSLNKSHRVSFQPPQNNIGFNNPQLTQTPLRNKDSEGTLVAPNLTGDDDASLSWLVQASMTTHNIYEMTSENWMNSKPIRLDVNDPETLRGLNTHKGASASNSTLYPTLIPKVRVTRSNTTGSLFASKVNVAHPTTPLSYMTPKRSRSVSFTSALLQNQMGKRPFSGDTFHSNKSNSQKNIIFERNEEANSPALELESKGNTFHFGKAEDNAAIVSESSSQNNNQNDQDLLPPNPTNHSLAPKSYTPSAIDVSSPINSSKENISSSAQGQLLRPAFTFENNKNSTPSPEASFSDKDMLNELESIPMAVHTWKSHYSDSAMKNISLQDWEINKDQWLQLRSESTPMFFSSIASRRSTGSLSAASAPSLHTYREQSDNGSSISHNTFFKSNDTLHKCVTPPQHDTERFIEQPAPDTSPIKKMIGRFKKKDSTTELNSPVVSNKHAHSNSIAASMASIASGISSKSGSPRKPRKIFFPRTSLDHQQKVPPPLNFAAPPRNVNTSLESPNSVPKPEFLLSTDRFWDIEAGDYSDKSRVSSVPSAVIGEYDREKWRTMKELERNYTEA